jgi:hypothetical protein
MCASVASFPRNSTVVPSDSGEWRSIGVAAGIVLGRVAYRSSVASNAFESLREEGGPSLTPASAATSIE